MQSRISAVLTAGAKALSLINKGAFFFDNPCQDKTKINDTRPLGRGTCYIRQRARIRDQCGIICYCDAP